MTWEVLAGRSGSAHFAKWIDVDAASRWLLAIQSLVERADNSTLMSDQHAAEVLAGSIGGASGPGSMSAEEWAAWRADRLARQTARCVELATAIRAFGLACDVDVFGLAPYAPGRVHGDDGGADYDGMYLDLGAWRRDAWALLRAQNADVARASDALVDLYPRVDYTAAGEVQSLADVVDPDSGSDRREGLTTDPSGWNPWSGYIVKTWSPPAGGASSRVEVTVLLPLKLSWELLSSCGRLMVARKIVGTLALSAAWVASRNARLSRVLGGTGLPSTIIEASAAVDVAKLGNGEIDPEVQGLLGAVVGLVTAVSGPVGLALGLIVGLAGILVRVLPPAVAHASDCWGHELPFLQRLALSGTLAPRAAPTHALVEVPPLYRAALPVPNPWADGLISSSDAPEGGPVEPLPGPEESGGGGAVAVGLLGLLALLAKWV